MINVIFILLWLRTFDKCKWALAVGCHGESGSSFRAHRCDGCLGNHRRLLVRGRAFHSQSGTSIVKVTRSRLIKAISLQAPTRPRTWGMKVIWSLLVWLFVSPNSISIFVSHLGAQLFRDRVDDGWVVGRFSLWSAVSHLNVNVNQYWFVDLAYRLGRWRG